MMYGIIQNARKGQGIQVLALVDRSKSRRLWWTSDNPNLAICYKSKSAADFAARRLRKNNPRVVPFSHVCSLLNQQARIRDEIEERRQHLDAMDELGWDAHKTEW